MGKKASVAEMMEDLVRRIAFHGDQEMVHGQKEALHAEQVRLHREEKARHAAAREQAAQQLAALQAAAESAAALLREAQPLPVPLAEAEAEVPSLLSRRVALVVKDWMAEGPFGATAVAEEIGRRFKGTPPVSVPTVQKCLLRLSKARVIRVVRKGKPHIESLFEKVGGA